MSARTSLLACTFLCLCLVTHGAHAQSLEGVDYESAVERALSANAAHDYATAKRYMEHAHALEPSARTLRGLGIIAYGEGDKVGALRRFEAALAEQTKPLPESLRASVAKLLVEVYAQLGRYELESAPDAQLSVDDRPAERDAQGRVLLTRGTHKLSLREGASVRTLDVRIMGGELGRLRFPDAAPGPASALTASRPGPRPRLASKPSQRDAQPSVRRRNPLAIGLASGGGAVLLASGGLALVARQRFHEAEVDCESMGGCYPRDKPGVYARHGVDTMTRAAWGSAIGGGVLLGVAGALWWAGVGEHKLTVQASLDPRAPALGLRGSF